MTGRARRRKLPLPAMGRGRDSKLRQRTKGPQIQLNGGGRALFAMPSSNERRQAARVGLRRATGGGGGGGCIVCARSKIQDPTLSCNSLSTYMAMPPPSPTTYLHTARACRAAEPCCCSPTSRTNLRPVRRRPVASLPRKLHPCRHAQWPCGRRRLAARRRSLQRAAGP